MGKRVLVIEDEPNIIEAISFILSRGGWEVKTHSNGHDAVDVVQAHAPDLIVLDVMLPGKSGFDILSEIREDARTTKTPVMMLTAKGQSRDRAAAEAAGVSVFMTKPFSNKEIVETVKSLLA